jgi:alpha/beta superfamily hydrolase
MTSSSRITPAVLGAVVGAIALAVVGFSWGGWVKGSTAEARAKERAESAVVAALLPLCVANFKAAADHAVHDAALRKTSSYDQAAYVQKGGWANMPGGTTANTDLARACADALTKVAQ